MVTLGRSSKMILENMTMTSENDSIEVVGLFSTLLDCILGLDINDPFKTATALNLFASTFTCLEFMTCSQNSLTSEPVEELVVSFLDRSLHYVRSITLSHTHLYGID